MCNSTVGFGSIKSYTNCRTFSGGATHNVSTVTDNTYMSEENARHQTYILQISVKLAKDVFFVPILTTWGGFMTNFFFSPVTISGFLARIMSNTLFNNYAVVVKRREKWHQCFAVEWCIMRQWYQ